MRLIVALVLVAVLGGCGSDETPRSTGTVPPRIEKGAPDPSDELLQEIEDATLAEDTTAFTASLTYEGPDANYTVVLNGKARFDATAAAFSMDYGPIADLLELPEEASPEELIVETLVMGDEIYMKLPVLTRSAGESRSWIYFSEEESKAKILELTRNDPTKVSLYLRGMNDVTAQGENSVRGVACAVHRGNVKPKTLIEAGWLGSARQFDGDVPVDICVDERNILRRLSYVAEVGPSKFVYQIELYDLGSPVDVAEPPVSDVVEASEFLDGELLRES